jgi:hypothetical protein
MSQVMLLRSKGFLGLEGDGLVVILNLLEGFL